MKTWSFIGLASILLALAAARYPDFFIVTFALIFAAFTAGLIYMAWRAARILRGRG